MAQHYKDLIASQRAMDLVAALYDATEAFPKRKTYSLTDQMRRAAVSIPATLRKDKPTLVAASFVIFFVTQTGPWPNLKLRYSLRGDEIILLKPKLKNCLDARTKWAES
jgi:hypothetical protein